MDDNLYISGAVDKTGMAQIIDLSGRVVYTEKDPFRNKRAISVQSLPSGLYFLKLDDKVRQFIKK